MIPEVLGVSVGDGVTASAPPDFVNTSTFVAEFDAKPENKNRVGRKSGGGGGGDKSSTMED